MHSRKITNNSTPQEIAAASVGTTLDRNGRPIISSVSQGQSYGKALKNITSNTQTGVAYVKPNPTGSKPSITETNYTQKEIEQLERDKGTKYVWEHVYNGDTSKYDPIKRASQITGIPLRYGVPVECGSAGKKAFDDALNGPKVFVDKKDAYGLTKTQKEKNADYIYEYLSKKGWTKEAICGLLGNIQRESSLNPCAWQDNNKEIDNSSVGYGLVQWTPASKFASTTGATTAAALDNIANDPERLMQMQLDFIISSCQPGEGEWLPSRGVEEYGSPYEMKFDDFTNSNKNPGDLALVFHGHYERSADNEKGKNDRVNYANEWFDYFSDK